MTTKLTTNRVTVTFKHKDGSFADAGQRSIRIVAAGKHKGEYGVERRNRILPVTVTGPNAVTCDLGAEPLAQGYEDAQSVAPVATLDQLGIVRKAKPATAAKPARGGKAKAQPKVGDGKSSLQEALALVRAHLDGKPLAEAQSVMAALLTADTKSTAKPSPQRRGRK